MTLPLPPWTPHLKKIPQFINMQNHGSKNDGMPFINNINLLILKKMMIWLCKNVFTNICICTQIVVIFFFILVEKQSSW